MKSLKAQLDLGRTLDTVLVLVRLLVTVEEGVLAGGFGSAVIEFLESIGYLDKP